MRGGYWRPRNAPTPAPAALHRLSPPGAHDLRRRGIPVRPKMTVVRPPVRRASDIGAGAVVKAGTAVAADEGRTGIVAAAIVERKLAGGRESGTEQGGEATAAQVNRRVIGCRPCSTAARCARVGLDDERPQPGQVQGAAIFAVVEANLASRPNRAGR